MLQWVQSSNCTDGFKGSISSRGQLPIKTKLASTAEPELGSLKVFVGVLRRALVIHLETQGLLPTEQHGTSWVPSGYTAKRGTVSDT